MPSKRDDVLRTLVVHFFHRFFDTDSQSEESVPRARLIQFLALIGTMAPALLFLLIVKGQIGKMLAGELDYPLARLTLHYTLVCYSMAAIGLAMTFRLDSLFPDWRDYLILTPLPISGHRLFAAKALALGSLLALYIVALNAVWLIGFLFIEPSAFAGHLAAAVGGSLFTALFIGAVQGALVNLLTPAALRRITPSVQMVLITLFVTILLLLPLLAEGLPLLVVSENPMLDYLPPVWFLGVYEVLSFGAAPIAYSWAWKAVVATALTAVLVLVSYVVGYRTHSQKVLNASDSHDLKPACWTAGWERLENVGLLPNGFQRAAFHFIGKISDRSPAHRVSTALYSGVGLALAVSSLLVINREGFPLQLSMMGMLQSPPVLSFLAVAGWRATFGIPYEIPANWVFQIADRRSAAEFRKAIRKWVLMCRILPLYVLVAVFEFAWFDSGTAVRHLIFDLVTTAFLIETFFMGFRKLPFTCEPLRNKVQIAFLGIAYFYAFLLYTDIMANLKRAVSVDNAHLTRFLTFSVVVAAALFIYRHISGTETSTMIYDEPDPPFQQLNLS